MSPTPLARLQQDIDSARVALGKRTTELSRQGRYLEAAALIEQDLATWPALLVPYPEAETKPFLEKWVKWQREGLELLRRRADWSERAATDLRACKALLLELLDQSRWDLDRADASDARVQVLLDAARSLDQQAMKLFDGRRLHVVVEAPALTEGQRANYARGLATDLRALGIQASAEAGDERFLVTASVEGPYSVHYVHDTFCQCELTSSAEWEGSGLPRIDLAQSGSGDEEDDDCVDNCIGKGSHLAARRVLRAWASLPESGKA